MTTNGGKVLQKAVMTSLPAIEHSHLTRDITSLSYVTQFDATRCRSLGTTSHGLS